MGMDKKDLIDALNSNFKELKNGMDMHCCLVNSILEDQVDEGDIRPILDKCPKRSREMMLEGMIKETIDVLEESRKAFKSKKLELLRKKLTHALISAD